MLKYALAALMIPGLLLLASCASSSYPLFVNTQLAEADNLREYCHTNGIKSLEVQKADSLATSARAKAEEGSENEAYWMVDASTTYYRLAIAKYELAAAHSEVGELRRALSSAREQLTTYKEVLNELENMKNR